MKTKILLTIFILLKTFVVTFAQVKRFEKGEIITKKGDTLNCLVEITSTYGDKIAYKQSKADKENFIRGREVKSLKTSFSTLESILCGKSERLMTELEKGKVTLYNYIEFQDTPTEQNNSGRQFRAIWRITYAIKMEDKYFEVESRPKKFKEQLCQLFRDCQPLIEKINTGKLDYSKVYNIVKEYNSCN